jgi:small-conductance mechanosensitive channel
VGDWSAEETFDVQKDPRENNVSTADLQAQFDLGRQVRDRLTEVHDTIRTIRSIRSQLANVVDRVEQSDTAPPVVDSIRTTADRIQAELTDIEEALIQTKNESPQDPINFPPQLDNQWAYLYTHVKSLYARPTEGTYERFGDLEAKTESQFARLRSVFDDLSALNTRLEKEAIPHVSPSPHH